MHRTSIFLCLAAALFPQGNAALATAPAAGRDFENEFLSIDVLPGWTVEPPARGARDCCTVTLTRDRYVLAINPLFMHASGIEGGRYYEILNRQPSVQAVLADVEVDEADACELMPSPETDVDREITLEDFYTDPAKAKDNDSGCRFPAEASPVWLGSCFGGVGPENDYSIALTYDSADVNTLPRKGSPELGRIFLEVAGMLRTLHMKPPLVADRVAPDSAAPGTTVTVYGKGFALPEGRITAAFTELPNTDLETRVAPDGRSLRFVIPATVTTIACPPGKIEVNEFCVPTPPGHVDINDCPPDSGGFCSIPFPPGNYHVSAEDDRGIWSNGVQLTVTAPPPTAITLLLLYPAEFVQGGDTITIRGRGFTATGNTVHFGSTLIPDLSSDHGSIRFTVPNNTQLWSPRFDVFVSNANGTSNALSLAYE